MMKFANAPDIVSMWTPENMLHMAFCFCSSFLATAGKICNFAFNTAFPFENNLRKHSKKLMIITWAGSKKHSNRDQKFQESLTCHNLLWLWNSKHFEVLYLHGIPKVPDIFFRDEKYLKVLKNVDTLKSDCVPLNFFMGIWRQKLRTNKNKK